MKMEMEKGKGKSNPWGDEAFAFGARSLSFPCAILKPFKKRKRKNGIVF